MPFLFMRPVLASVLAVLGAFALTKFITREWQRVNDELHPSDSTIDDGEIAKLTRDPKTGVYHPE